jgi:hypothetical protein
MPPQAEGLPPGCLTYSVNFRLTTLRTHLINTYDYKYEPLGRHQEIGTPDMNSRLVNQLFRQADSLAKCLQPRIAAQQAGTLTIHTEQKPADPNRPKSGDAIQGFEDSVFIA